MNKAVIFLNADGADFSRVKKYIDDNTLLIGCDGGTNFMLGLSYKPHAIIGDFDSIDKKLLGLKGVKYVKYPRDKDYTDSELAIKYALEQGIKEIIIAGLLGTRIDHSLGNIFLLFKKEFRKANIKVVEGNQEIYAISGRTTIKGKKGQTISLIPLEDDIKNAKSTGLKYKLDKYTLSMQGNKGISNVLTKDTAEINLEKGSLLVVHIQGGFL